MLKLDALGFIENASDNIIEIGLDLSEHLLKPHLTDLVGDDHRSELSAFFERSLDDRSEGAGDEHFIEISIAESIAGDSAGETARPRWFSLCLRAIHDDGGKMIGALGLLRSIERLRALECEVHSRALIDPLTGLSNRHAFCASLRRQLLEGEPATLALFEIDRIRAIVLQYGQRTADEIIWGFAKFLEAMAAPSYELAHFEGERLAVILPETEIGSARAWVGDVLANFEMLAATKSQHAPRLTAIAGLAPVWQTVDLTLRKAEVALVLARARGGLQLAPEIGRDLTRPDIGRSHARSIQQGMRVVNG